MTACGLAIALSVFGRKFEEAGKVIGCLAYFGLMYAAIPVVFKHGSKNEFVLFAWFVLCFSILYITMFSYLWFRQNSASRK